MYSVGLDVEAKAKAKAKAYLTPARFIIAFTTGIIGLPLFYSKSLQGSCKASHEI